MKNVLCSFLATVVFLPSNFSSKFFHDDRFSQSRERGKVIQTTTNDSMKMFAYLTARNARRKMLFIVSKRLSFCSFFIFSLCPIFCFLFIFVHLLQFIALAHVFICSAYLWHQHHTTHHIQFSMESRNWDETYDDTEWACVSSQRTHSRLHFQWFASWTFLLHSHHYALYSAPVEFNGATFDVNWNCFVRFACFVAFICFFHTVMRVYTNTEADNRSGTKQMNEEVQKIIIRHK